MFAHFNHWLLQCTFTALSAELINCVEFSGDPGWISFFCKCSNLCLWWRHQTSLPHPNITPGKAEVHISWFWALVSLLWYKIALDSEWISQFALHSQCHFSQSVRSILFCEIPWSWNCCGEQCALWKLCFPLHNQSLAEKYSHLSANSMKAIQHSVRTGISFLIAVLIYSTALTL